MKISRFVGANSREVMRQVRQMLGPDALIVSNRSVDGGVEVLATVDGAFDDAPSESGQRESSAGSGRDPIASGAASEAASGFAAGVAPGNAPNAAPASTPYAAPSASPLSAPGFAPGFAPGVTPGFAPAFASPAASHAASPSTQHAVPPSAQHSMPPSAQHSMPPSAQPPASRPAYLAGPAGAASPATASSPFGTPAPSQPASYVTPARSISAYQSAFASSALPEDETPGEQGAAPQAAAPELAASRSAAPQAAAPQAAAPQSGVLPATSALAAAATRVELPALPAARPPLSAPPPVSMPSPGMHAQPPVSMPPPGTHAQPPVSMPSPGMRAQPPVAMPYPGMRAQPPVAMPSPGMHAQPPVAMPSPGMHAQPPVAMPSPDMRAQPPVSMPSPGMHAQSPATSAQPPVAMPSSAMAAQQSAAMPPSSMTAQPPVAAPAPVAYAASAGAAAYAAHSAAAAHTAPAAPSAPAASAASMARTPDAPLRQPSPSATLPSAALPTDTAAGLQDAISALRGALETRMDGLLWGGRQGSAREAAAAALFRSLLDAGFSTKLVRALVERLPQGLSTEAAQAWARNELVTHLPVVASEDEFLAGGVYALVGPTGVGKTTTLAKLAARCVAREGRDQVAMLTTDLFRIGALEQLQIYGRLMGVPAHSVRDAGELRRILNELGNRKIVLIDTTGISQRDRLVAEQAAMLCNAGKPVRRLLVLNAASQGDTLDEVAHAYRNGVGEDVAGCIITKLDEATRLGAALDTAIRHRLPIHYMSVGQKVPEHMELARADVLIDRAFGMVERARALYTPSEADLASLLPTARDADAVDPARRRQLLASAILRPQGGSASITAAQNLDHTIAMLDNDPACVQARASWRDYVGDGAGASLAALGDEPLAMVRREFSANSNRHLLVMHGKTNMKGENLPGGTMMGSLLMSDRGVALAAPAQQLALAHGMLTSFAPAAAGLPDAGPALEARVRWLGEQLPRLPLVHMLEAGTPALWQSLSGQGASWVARCPGGMRVIQEECPTNLNAVGKSVGYLPVGQPGDMPGLIRETAAKRTPLALWASGTEITLPGRGETTSMRLVCARLIDTATGEVDTQLFGLTNLPASQADAATVARWLVLQDEAKAAFRYVASAWQALPAVDGSHTLARQSLMAGQLGAACWQMAHSPSADVVRGPLSGIMGTDRKLSGRLLPVAILKMFAMLEMTGGA